jgi:hypothetical protein
MTHAETKNGKTTVRTPSKLLGPSSDTERTIHKLLTEEYTTILRYNRALNMTNNCRGFPFEGLS